MAEYDMLKILPKMHNYSIRYGL